VIYDFSFLIVPENYFSDYQFEYPAERERISPGTWLKHLALLVATFCTTTIAALVEPFGYYVATPRGIDAVVEDPIRYLSWIPTAYSIYLIDVVYQMLFLDPSLLGIGLRFSLSLLFILFCHEMGHYVACRIYGVKATLPYFIPTPPMVAAGTFGAVIRIRSPMKTRKVIFDIGIAGPIAGFIALIPVAIAGIVTMKMQPPGPVPSDTIVFADPLLMQLIGAVFGKDVSLGIPNSYYFAAWIGMLVTALNLIPSGQLDGGHAIYAALGEKVHSWTGKIAFVVMAVLSVLGLLFYGSPSGFIVVILLGLMMRIGHPRPWDDTPIDGKRKVVALLTLVIFILCFNPIPLRIT
jgi:membrane-associated protease RseP (regulator of RpoE activity)